MRLRNSQSVYTRLILLAERETSNAGHQRKRPPPLAELPEGRRAVVFARSWWEGWGLAHDLECEGHGNCDGFVVEGGRLKAELANRRENGTIKIGVRRFRDLNVCGLAGFVDLEAQDNFRLVKCDDVWG